MNFARSLVLLALGLAPLGCLSPEMRIEDLRYRTAAVTDCQREDIKIRGEQFTPYWAWTAICGGVEYACVKTVGSDSTTGPITPSQVICRSGEKSPDE